MALLLDLRLRGESGGACSLDSLMGVLWRDHGQTGVGVAVAHRLRLDTPLPVLVHGSFANSGGLNVGRTGVAVEF